MIVAVTGICSKLGQNLVPKLQKDPRVTRIIGIDLAPFPGEQTKITSFTQDIRDLAALTVALTGADLVIHLAFIVDPKRLPAKKVIHDINVGGSRNVCQAALAAGVKSILYLSSSAVYGLSRENPRLIDENAMRRGRLNTHFYYPYCKGLVEDFLDTFEKAHPEICVTRLRAPFIIGPHFLSADTLLGIKGKRHFQLIVPYNFDGKVPLQLIHEDDLTDVILLTLGRNLRGSYNVASDAIADLKKFLSETRACTIGTFPRFWVRIVIFFGRLWPKFKWLESALFPVVMRTDKIRAELGWHPQYPAETWFEPPKAGGK